MLLLFVVTYGCTCLLVHVIATVCDFPLPIVILCFFVICSNPSSYPLQAANAFIRHAAADSEKLTSDWLPFVLRCLGLSCFLMSMCLVVCCCVLCAVCCCCCCVLLLHCCMSYVVVLYVVVCCMLLCVVCCCVVVCSMLLCVACCVL